MPPPDLQLTLPDFATGYRPPRLFNETLKLDPQLAALMQPFPPTLGWYARARNSYSPITLGNDYVGLNDALAPYLSNLSTLATQNPNQPLSALLPQALAGAGGDRDLLDKIQSAVAKAAQDKFWPKVTGPGTNVASGEQATIGSLDSSGKVVYDGLDEVVPGTELSTSYLPDKWKLGKRFGFSSGYDVHFSLYADKDALLNQKPDAMFSGGAITIEGKTSDGVKRSLKIIGGRSQTGGPAGAILFDVAMW